MLSTSEDKFTFNFKNFLINSFFSEISFIDAIVICGIQILPEKGNPYFL